MVLIKTRLFLKVMLKPLKNLSLLYLFPYRANIPDQIFSQYHTSYSIIIFCIRNFMDFRYVLYFFFWKMIFKHCSDLFLQLFCLLWQLLRFNVVGNNYFVRRSKFNDLYWIYFLSSLHIKDYISSASRIIAFFNILYPQIYPHLIHQWDQPQIQTLLARRFRNISPSFNFYWFIISQSCEYRHETLKHQCAASCRARSNMLWSFKVRVNIYLCFPHFWYLISKSTEHRSQLIIDARLRSIFSD